MNINDTKKQATSANISIKKRAPLNEATPYGRLRRIASLLGNSAMEACLRQDSTPVSTDLATKNGGRELSSALREKFETRSGVSLDDVRVHYNSDKPDKLGALAYARGSEIHIGPGQEKHLEHELGHVVQQKQGLVQPTGEIDGQPVNVASDLETSADMLPAINSNSIFTAKEFNTIQFALPEGKECLYIVCGSTQCPYIAHWNEKHRKYDVFSYSSDSGKNFVFQIESDTKDFFEIGGAEFSQRTLPRQRLFLGEENASFTRAFIKKHPGLSSTITSTVYGAARPDCASELELKGVSVRTGVDATSLPPDFSKETQQTTDEYFHYPRSSLGMTKQLIVESAREAWRILPVGGRFHVTVPASDTYMTRGRSQLEGEKTRNKMYGADTLSIIKRMGFKLLHTVADPQERYNDFGYAHRMTGKGKPHPTLKGREYVFVKLRVPPEDVSGSWTDDEVDHLSESDEEDCWPKKKMT